jgi:hypothetical protein
MNRPHAMPSKIVGTRRLNSKSQSAVMCLRVLPVSGSRRTICPNEHRCSSHTLTLTLPLRHCAGAKHVSRRYCDRQKRGRFKRRIMPSCGIFIEANIHYLQIVAPGFLHLPFLQQYHSRLLRKCVSRERVAGRRICFIPTNQVAVLFPPRILATRKRSCGKHPNGERTTIIRRGPHDQYPQEKARLS